jgi:SAM-dependent methyltransferase
LKPGARIWEARSGLGRDIKIFLQKGHEVEAFNSSIQMVRLNSDYIGHMTRFLKFGDMDYVDEFDGIRACASLLHVSREELPDVFRRLERALKKGGVLYASFKVGSDYSENGRDFVSFKKDEILEYIKNHIELQFRETLITKDVRENQKDVLWINLFYSK